MKQRISSILVLVLALFLGIYSYRNLLGAPLFYGAFISGLSIGMLLMLFRLNVKDGKLKLYKRELEKESISSETHSAKVKVLESKIEVLEKALDEAIKK